MNVHNVLDDPDSLELQAEGEDLDRYFLALNLGSARTILDVGCGSGAFTRALAQRIGPEAKLIGLDASQAQVSYAIRRVRKLGPANVSFMQGDVLNPPPELIGWADLVLCRYFLMYFVRADRAIECVRHMAHLASPGGRIAALEVDANFGQDRFPPAGAELTAVLRGYVQWCWDTECLDWRSGMRLYSRFRSAGLDDVRISIVDGRIIAGGEPRALAEHGSRNVEELLAPYLEEVGLLHRLDAVSAEWRSYLSDPGTFLCTPVFLAVGTKKRG